MRKIDFDTVATKLGELIENTLRSVEDETVSLLKKARASETNETAVWAIDSIIKNAEIASNERCFACQDCGLAIIFVQIGYSLKLDFNLTDAINEGVRRGYRDARKSVAHPLNRTNTGDNTPAIIYTDFIEGNSLKISYLAKGAGSENMSKVYMLTPSKGEDGIVNSVLDCVVSAGANPCPPIVIGVGIGGTMDYASVLSKKALLRPTGKASPDQTVAKLERRILDKVNETGIGAQGLGGKTTALAVAVETFPTHIGMLPVAVTVGCHSVRHGSIEF
ncbi:MAG: fumarate hydratase [Clostridia bacterium]|nr:fumarate hydratase [Clostridia bacterium]